MGMTGTERRRYPHIAEAVKAESWERDVHYARIFRTFYDLQNAVLAFCVIEKKNG
jgi:hypothetical protein